MIRKTRTTSFYAKLSLCSLIVRHTLSRHTFYDLFYVLLLGTNINDAVLRGVNMLVTDRQQKRLPEKNIDMIILLTDGMPNSGEHLEFVHTVGYAVYLCVVVAF